MALTTAMASVIGTGLSFLGGMYQNAMQEQFYNKYQSPQARMRQMMEAGINPNAAAQGVSGAAAPGMSASGPANGFGDMVAAIPQLTAEIERIKSDTSKNQAEEKYFDSLTTGKDIENKFNFETFEKRIESLNLDNEHKSYIIDTLRPYADHADEWYQINFNQLDETVKKIKKEISEIDEKIKNLGEEREVMETQEGLNVANANEANARAALERQKKELIDKLGGEDAESAYVISRVEGDDKKADAIKEGITTFVKDSEKARAEGNLSVTAGHDGVVGKTLDVLTRFSGLRHNTTMMDVLSGFGISFDKRNMPHFAPIDKLWNRITRPSYSDWKVQMRNKIGEAEAQLVTDFNHGKITKSEFTSTRAQLQSLRKSGLTEEAYKETFGIRR